VTPKDSSLYPSYINLHFFSMDPFGELCKLQASPSWCRSVVRWLCGKLDDWGPGIRFPANV